MDAKPIDVLPTPDQGKDEAGRRRGAIRSAYREPEPVCVPPLIEEARLDPALSAKVESLAYRLVSELRAERGHTFGVEALMKEFSLSTREGVALMCLAESLLRIPDNETRDALIRDKLSHGDWGAHVGASPSWFVNASAWGLLITGKLVATSSEHGMAASLGRVLARGGEPVIRKAMDLGMRLLGKQFVTGKTIEEALEHARPLEERGFLYSFDMLGEAALTEDDAANYVEAYERAIEAVGIASSEPSIYEAGGISVKLSALHPRYSYTQMDRVKSELYPRLRKLALSAIQQNIGFNIDAEEADRLEPSLDLFETLANDSALGRWQGLGFVVQAYQKRAPFVIDYLIDLAERTKRRLMVRLVKGAYWDSEIKRAQVDGLSGYPVYTQKSYTDVCYLACAKRLLARRDVIFPQFATHNAHTLAAIYHMAGPNFKIGDYEFQCLHGMGETLYSRVIGEKNLNRPCRIYAPVGTHETLLAYLVRRLLENGANTSFVHQLVDEKIPIEELIADPVAEAARLGGAPHPLIALPRDLFAPERQNSKGLDLSDAAPRAELERAVTDSTSASHDAEPILATPAAAGQTAKAIQNPASHADLVGHATAATEKDVEAAMASAASAAQRWAETKAERAGRDPRTRRRPHGTVHGAAERASHPRGGQIHAERHLGSARSCRLLPLLRGSGSKRARRTAQAARANGLHQPLEFSPRDFHRADRGGSRGGEPGSGETRRADAPDCGGGGPAASSGWHPTRRSPTRSRAGLCDRGCARRRHANAGRCLYGFDRGGALDPGHACGARQRPAHRRDRRTERDDRRLVRAPRAGGGRRAGFLFRTRRGSAARRFACFAFRTPSPIACLRC